MTGVDVEEVIRAPYLRSCGEQRPLSRESPTWGGNSLVPKSLTPGAKPRAHAYYLSKLPAVICTYILLVDDGSIRRRSELPTLSRCNFVILG